MHVLALLDGTLADPTVPMLRVDDLGVMRGDGVFETILVVDGKPRELVPHLDRLARSAAMMDLPAPDLAAWERACQTVLGNWTGSSEHVLKLVLTRGVEGTGVPTEFALGMEIAPTVLRQRAEGIAAVTLDRGFGPDVAERAPWLLLGAKSLSYAVNMAAVREAARRGADDVVFLASDGTVLEGPTSTVVAVHEGVLRTPPSTLGILPGTTQHALFRAAESAGRNVKVEALTVADLHAADGVFLCSSVRTVTRLHTLDGARLEDSSELHAEMVELYQSEYR